VSVSGKTWVVKVLLVCGILSSLFCIGTDIIAATLYENYSYTDQAVSELTAIGAPTRPLVVSLLIAVAVLVVAFSAGVLLSAGKKHALRIAGILLAIYGFVSLISFFFPMNPRGTEQSFTGLMHLISGGVAVLLIMLFIGFGSAARGKGFRIYSTGPIIAILVFGTLAAMQGARVAVGLPTPWFGIIERVSYYSPMLWMLVFAIVLLRVQVMSPGTPSQN
jgi:hypothetical protein